MSQADEPQMSIREHHNARSCFREECLQVYGRARHKTRTWIHQAAHYIQHKVSTQQQLLFLNILLFWLLAPLEDMSHANKASQTPMWQVILPCIDVAHELCHKERHKCLSLFLSGLCQHLPDRTQLTGEVQCQGVTCRILQRATLMARSITASCYILSPPVSSIAVYLMWTAPENPAVLLPAAALDIAKYMSHIRGMQQQSMKMAAECIVDECERQLPCADNVHINVEGISCAGSDAGFDNSGKVVVPIAGSGATCADSSSNTSTPTSDPANEEALQGYAQATDIKVQGDEEVLLTVQHALGDGRVRVKAFSTWTMKDVKHAMAQKLGKDSIVRQGRIVQKIGKSRTFVAVDDNDLVGNRQRLLFLGADLPVKPPGTAANVAASQNKALSTQCLMRWAPSRKAMEVEIQTQKTLRSQPKSKNAANQQKTNAGMSTLTPQGPDDGELSQEDVVHFHMYDDSDVALEQSTEPEPEAGPTLEAIYENFDKAKQTPGDNSAPATPKAIAQPQAPAEPGSTDVAEPLPLESVKEPINDVFLLVTNVAAVCCVVMAFCLSLISMCAIACAMFWAATTLTRIAPLTCTAGAAGSALAVGGFSGLDAEGRTQLTCKLTVDKSVHAEEKQQSVPASEAPTPTKRPHAHLPVTSEKPLRCHMLFASPLCFERPVRVSLAPLPATVASTLHPDDQAAAVETERATWGLQFEPMRPNILSEVHPGGRLAAWNSRQEDSEGMVRPGDELFQLSYGPMKEPLQGRTPQAALRELLSRAGDWLPHGGTNGGQPSLGLMFRALRALSPLGVSEELTSLRESGCEVISRAATVDNIRALIASAECRILHISMHCSAEPRLLFLEDGVGKAHIIRATEFQDLLSQGQSQQRISLVFLSTCHSCSLGKHFVAAGVRHVVCVKDECEVRDSSCKVFARDFFAALRAGRSVKEAFDCGVAVLAHGQDVAFRSDASAFALLPANADHTEVFAPGGAHIAVEPAIEGGAWGSLQAPVEDFLGREVDQHRLIQQVHQRRFVEVVGEPGVGKSALTAEVGRFLQLRSQRFAEVRWVDGVDSRLRAECSAGLEALRARLALEPMRRVLLLVDDAACFQWAPLWPLLRFSGVHVIFAGSSPSDDSVSSPSATVDPYKNAQK